MGSSKTKGKPGPRYKAGSRNGAGGQPSLYKPEYIQQLLDHSKEGYSFESFGAKVGVHRDTLYNWCDLYPEFSDARKRAKELLTSYFEDIFKRIYLGQLRRVKSEKPLMTTDDKGKACPVVDKHGEVIMEREYEYFRGEPTALIFASKNMIGWKNQVAVEHGGSGGGPIKFTDATDEEIKRQARLMVEQMENDEL